MNITAYLFKMGSRKKAGREIIRFLVFLGVFASAIAQGNPQRKWSVRKTGEFGRRIESVSKELQLPQRHFRLQELNLDLSESRRYDPYSTQGAGIKRPSLDLELPHLNSLSSDQEAQETGESDGYVYAPPEVDEDGVGGYSYNTPSPIANQNVDEPEPTSPPLDKPSPVEPNVVAGPGDSFFTQLPLAKERETDEDIDSAGLSAGRKRPDPSFPQVSAVANHQNVNCDNDDDPSCWNHDYTDVIPGVAGTDYPVLARIVDTSFDCNEQQFSGYYADFDEAARCQIFHICLLKNKYRKARQWSFLCPNGTLFSQQDLVCVLWTDAPECNQATVRSLYNVNQELGWDNITEVAGNKMSNRNAEGELQSAMSAFREAMAANKDSTKYDPNPPTRSGLPYRIPVKINEEAGRPRTKLQEVTQNALHGSAHELDYGDNTEHDVEESSNFETSLRKQSQSQHKTKSSSRLRTSTSEAYELKGSADGVQPFIVNRPSPHNNKGHNKDPSEVPGNGYENDQTEGPQHIVMMPAVQKLPDGSEQYTMVPVMMPHGAYEDSPSEGYSYPNPNERESTPAPTYLPPSTTPPADDFAPPTVPTEPPLDRENYENADYQNAEMQSTTENAEESGYQYPNPTTTERSEEGFNLPKRTKEEQTDSGYRYPDPSNTEEPEEGYRYPNPTTTENPEEGYRYPDPTTTENPEEGYRYPQPTTTENSEEGYRYPSPTTVRSSRLENTTPPSEPPTGSEETDAGYQYPVPDPDQQLGYNYQPPTTTDQSPQNDTNYPNEQYQVTENEVSGGYDIESTTAHSNYSPDRNQDLVDSTEGSISTTTLSPENGIPEGEYLPPSTNDQINSGNVDPAGKPIVVDEDTVGIAGGQGEGDSDYDEEENEVVTGPTGSPEGGGYSYNSPTPPSSSGSDPAVLNGGALDSDEKVNEILKQIQNGGIEAVDANGKPIEFDKLKELLLKSPRGSVELKGLENVDSVTSSSTEIPNSPQTEQPRQSHSQAPEEQPYYHTVTTANVLPTNANLFNTNQNQLTASSPRDVRPSSSLYLPPNANNNNNAQQQHQQYYNTNNNNNILIDQPTYDIKLPNREFESHSVLTNTIDNNNNRNNGQFTSNIQNQNLPSQQYQPQIINDHGYFSSTPPQVQNVQYQVQPTPQQQFFPNQNYQSNPTLSTTLVIPNDNSHPPPPQQRRPQQDYQRPPSFQNNLIIPSPQAQHQFQQQQQVIPTGPSAVQQPQGVYLPPPRQASSSILQSQYYNVEASSNSQSRQPFLSQPIQLTENLQLQQSFAQTLPPLQSGNRNSNPFVNPKDIKIVPAVFVHQHTSIASQNGNGGSSSPGNNDGFQNLDTSQSVYLPSDSAAKYGASSLAQQLNQLANSVYLPQGSSTGRQFTRRSNGGSSSSSSRGGRSSSSSSTSSLSSLPSEPSHTIEKATQVTTFTLEDARTPEELQKYHHQDLKRFHSENIAKKSGLLEDAYVAPPVPIQRPSQTTIPRVEHRFVTERPRTTTSNNNNHNDRRHNANNGHRTDPERGSSIRPSSVQSTTHSNNSKQPDRFSLNTSNLSSSRGRSHEEFFIPVSGSYGGSGGGGSSSSGSRSSTTSSRHSNSDGSQFRVSGRGGGGRSYVDSESETTLLSRFAPEENGGFGARLL